MIDIHSHTKYSHDSKEEPENMVLKAIQKNGKIFGFSEHLNFNKKTDFDFAYKNLQMYFKEVNHLKRKYSDKIMLISGIEFDYQNDQIENYLKADKEFPFDYIINSMHNVYGIPYFDDVLSNKYDKMTLYKEYLINVLQSLDADYDYQVLGHLGQLSKYATYPDKDLTYEDFPLLISSILSKIIVKGKALELNTNTDSDFLPHNSIISKYFNMGGRNITIASDAHAADRVYDKNIEAVNYLKQKGFTYICYYINKKLNKFNI